jgi:hypothetical protein
MMDALEEKWAFLDTLTPAKLVEIYIGFRDAKKEAEDKIAEEYSKPMVLLEGKLLNKLNELEVESLSSDRGTVYKLVRNSVTVADQREFRRHIIGSEGWDLADWRANKTAVNELVEAGEALPPGVNYTQVITVGIRRK